MADLKRLTRPPGNAGLLPTNASPSVLPRHEPGVRLASATIRLNPGWLAEARYTLGFQSTPRLGSGRPHPQVRVAMANESGEAPAERSNYDKGSRSECGLRPMLSDGGLESPRSGG